MNVRLGKKNPLEIPLYNLSSRRDNAEKLTAIVGGGCYSSRNIVSGAKTPHVYPICQTVTIINHPKNKRKSIWTDELNFYLSTNHCCTLVVVYNFLKRHPCVYTRDIIMIMNWVPLGANVPWLSCHVTQPVYKYTEWFSKHDHLHFFSFNSTFIQILIFWNFAVYYLLNIFLEYVDVSKSNF